MTLPAPMTTDAVTAASAKRTLQLIGLDRIAEMLQVTREELEEIVAGVDFPRPFIQTPHPGYAPHRLWTDLSVALYRLRSRPGGDRVHA